MTDPFATHGITHLSASKLNLFAAEPAMFIVEHLLGKKQPVGAAAHRGTSAEEGIVHGLMTGADDDACIEVAMRKWHELTALSGDPRKEKEADGLPGIVRMGLMELRPYGTPTKTQGRIEHYIDGIEVPLIGFFDVFWENHGILIDIKTQLALTSEIKASHARQVALYATAISDNIDARLTYITPKKSATYGLQDVRSHYGAVVKMAHTVRRFLSLSRDPHELAGILMPNLESYFWSPPAARAVAYEVWAI
jgi:hypothetical protein